MNALDFLNNPQYLAAMQPKSPALLTQAQVNGLAAGTAVEIKWPAADTYAPYLIEVDEAGRRLAQLPGHPGLFVAVLDQVGPGDAQQNVSLQP